MELIILGCDGAYPSANGVLGYPVSRHGCPADGLGVGVLPKLMAWTRPKRHFVTHGIMTRQRPDPAYLEITGLKLPLYAPAVHSWPTW